MFALSAAVQGDLCLLLLARQRQIDMERHGMLFDGLRELERERERERQSHAESGSR